jgi:dimethylglycine dehydrogenase
MVALSSMICSAKRRTQEVVLAKENRALGDLPTDVRVAVIGGGVMGCSTLYHLTRLGWTDVVLLEKSQLTAGSTWHAAGMVPGFAESLLVTRILKDSLDTYAELATDTDDPVDVHRCGSIKLARSEDELTENRRFLGFARLVGMEAEIIGPNRIRELYPLIETPGVIGGLWLPNDCYTDPSQTTHAYARRARRKGARIVQNAEVTAIQRKVTGDWRIETSRGIINAEIVVNCGGMWAREISALAGGILPAISIEHEYLVTESIPEIEALDFELPMLWDMSTPMYTRADRNGLIVSCYEDQPKFFALNGVPPDFGQELLPPDLDRTENKLEAIFGMIPSLRSAGIRTVVNGPTPRSPDMMPLVGPAHGYDNFYVMCGVSGGFLFSSTARYLAEWIVQGEPSINLTPFDVRRFGGYADTDYAVARLSSGHAFEKPVYYPHVEHSGARAIRTTPLYERLKTKGAVFGGANDWGTPNWFAPNGVDPTDRPSYGRANWFDHVGAEYAAIRRGVAVMDASALAKFEVSGPHAARHLDRLSANRLPKPNTLRAGPMLNERGHFEASTLIARNGNDRFYVTSALNCAQRDEQWLRSAAGADVRIENVSADVGVLALVGPKAKDVLSGLTDAARLAMPTFGFQEATIASVPARILKLNWGKTPVWELHASMGELDKLYDAIMRRGREFDVKDFGKRAMQAVQIESGIPTFGVDFASTCTPADVGLEHLVDLQKGDFVGRSALERGAKGGARNLVRIAIDTEGAGPITEPWGDEPVMVGDRCVGVITSASFSYGIGKPVAFAFVDRDATKAGTGLEVLIVGSRMRAAVLS